ncbi:MAG TPA: hypothetical protein VE860_04275 [Chthoniobacterales bacterium]|nr:hypothetical protein [Chthoniobacterales bacterium]
MPGANLHLYEKRINPRSEITHSGDCATGGDTQSLLIPANTLIFGQDGISVGTVGNHNKVEVRKIKTGKDLGTSVEVTQGLSPDDRVILNPSASLATGQTVRIR